MGDCIWGFLKKYALYIALVCLPLYAVFWFLDYMVAMLVINFILPLACLYYLAKDERRMFVNYFKALALMLVCAGLLCITFFGTNTALSLGLSGELLVVMFAFNVGFFLYYIHHITFNKPKKKGQQAPQTKTVQFAVFDEDTTVDIQPNIDRVDDDG